MSRIVYVNGDYVPETAARVSVFDRGFLMSDAVYEVTAVLDGKLVDFDGHVKRLTRSLGELDMENPLDSDSLLEIHRELVRLNGLDEGLVYLQVTRGVADRDFAYPEDTTPTVVLFTQVKSLAESAQAETGIPGRFRGRPSLGTAGHQDRSTALSVHVKNGGESPGELTMPGSFRTGSLLKARQTMPT